MRLSESVSKATAVGFLMVVGSSSVVAQPSNDYFSAAAESVVTILITADGESQAVGSGLIVRSDGVILTALHLVRGAREIRVRLLNGETYDHAELVKFDERRNIALLRIPATGLYVLPQSYTEESLIGTRVVVAAAKEGRAALVSSGVLTGLTLADDVRGAGEGFRVLKFTGESTSSAAGGVLLDDKGRAIGLMAALPEAATRNYAVPMSSLFGLIRTTDTSSANNLPSAPPRASTTPVPISQSRVMVPERGVLALDPKGPGSVVVKPATRSDVLMQSKTIYVHSRTVFFKPEQLVNELNKRAELSQWRLTFVDDRRVADLVLTLDHLLFTYKFTFSLAHERTGMVIATGDVIIFDGNLGAPKMAKRVVEKLTTVRSEAATKPPETAKPEKK